MSSTVAKSDEKQKELQTACLDEVFPNLISLEAKTFRLAQIRRYALKFKGGSGEERDDNDSDSSESNASESYVEDGDASTMNRVLPKCRDLSSWNYFQHLASEIIHGKKPLTEVPDVDDDMIKDIISGKDVGPRKEPQQLATNSRLAQYLNQVFHGKPETHPVIVEADKWIKENSIGSSSFNPEGLTRFQLEKLINQNFMRIQESVSFLEKIGVNSMAFFDFSKFDLEGRFICGGTGKACKSFLDKSNIDMNAIMKSSVGLLELLNVNSKLPSAPTFDFSSATVSQKRKYLSDVVTKKCQDSINRNVGWKTLLTEASEVKVNGWPCGVGTDQSKWSKTDCTNLYEALENGRISFYLSPPTSVANGSSSKTHA